MEQVQCCVGDGAAGVELFWVWSGWRRMFTCSAWMASSRILRLAFGPPSSAARSRKQSSFAEIVKIDVNSSQLPIRLNATII